MSSEIQVHHRIEKIDNRIQYESGKIARIELKTEQKGAMYNCILWNKLEIAATHSR